MVLTYAEIPFTPIYDEEVLSDQLLLYDWLHLHHEDFTGQYGKFFGISDPVCELFKTFPISRYTKSANRDGPCKRPTPGLVNADNVTNVIRYLHTVSIQKNRQTRERGCRVFNYFSICVLNF